MDAAARFPKQPKHAKRIVRCMPIARVLLAVAAAVVLALVFLAYMRPGFVFDLANRFILCL